MKKIDAPLIVIGIITVVVIAGIIFVTLKADSGAKKYSTSDSTKPKIEISEENFDFGKTNVSETKTKEITIKNIGAEPLNISDFYTSCDCTFVTVVIGDQKSPKFSMNQTLGWSKDLAAGETATLEISYVPRIMPIEGEVSRIVYFKTNDPDKPDVAINFKADVTK